MAPRRAGEAPRTFPLLPARQRYRDFPANVLSGAQNGDGHIPQRTQTVWRLKTNQQDALGAIRINSQFEGSASQRLLWCDTPNQPSWGRWWVAGGKDQPGYNGKGEQHLLVWPLGSALWTAALGFAQYVLALFNYWHFRKLL